MLQTAPALRPVANHFVFTVTFDGPVLRFQLNPVKRWARDRKNPWFEPLRACLRRDPLSAVIAPDRKFFGGASRIRTDE